MVTRNCIRLVTFLLLFICINNILISEDNVSNIDLKVNDAIDEYRFKKLKIIDIRTEKEWKMTGIIPGSYLLNMHNEDYSENKYFIENVQKLLDQNNNSTFAFICASGARSEIVVNFFKEKKYDNIYHIPEGILGKEKNGWLYLGFPIEIYNEN